MSRNLAASFPPSGSPLWALEGILRFQRQLELANTVSQASRALMEFARSQPFEAVAFYTLSKWGELHLLDSASLRKGNLFDSGLAGSFDEAGRKFINDAVPNRIGEGAIQFWSNPTFRYRDLDPGRLSSGVAIPVTCDGRAFGVAVFYSASPVLLETAEQAEVRTAQLATTMFALKLGFLAAKDDVAQVAEISSITSREGSLDTNYVALGYALETLVSGGLFVAAVLRLESSGSLRLIKKVSDPSVTWEGWQDHDLTETHNAIVARQVFDKGEPVIRYVSDVKDEQFLNKGWLDRQAIKMVICLPLKIEARPMGTITVYACREFTWDVGGTRVLSNVAESLVKYAHRCVMYRKVRNVEEMIRECSGSGPSEHDMLHFLRDMLGLCRQEVSTVRDLDVRRRLDLLPQKIDEIEGRMAATAELIGRLLTSGPPARIDLVDFLPELGGQCQRLLPRIEFLADNVKGYVFAQKSDLATLLVNLILNSAKAINRKQLAVDRIELSAHPTLGGVKLSVRDNGVGMTLAQQRIYLSAIRDKSHSLAPGWGARRIGEILQEYGAVIEIESEIDRGTSVCVTFPHARSRR